MIVEFRRRTRLPLDGVLGCLRDSIPKLTRSSLHRCLFRRGISRLPENPEQASKRGKLNMFLAIGRVSKFTYAEFHDNAGKMNGADFLRGVVAAFP